MKLRMTLAAAVLGLAVATVTLARQQPDREQVNSPARAAFENLRQMRAQVAELRAEVEIGDIEHEADKALLTLMMKEIGEAQWKETSQQADSGGARTAKTKDIADRERKQRDKIDMLEAEVQHMKGQFRRRVIKLHEMKFALADLEERLANGWGR